MKKTLYLLIACAIWIFSAAPSDAKEPDLSKLPGLLGANNVGTDFWFSLPPCYEETAGNNFVKIFIASEEETMVHVEVPGKGFFREKMTVPGGVIEFDLPPVIGQPYSKGNQSKPNP